MTLETIRIRTVIDRDTGCWLWTGTRSSTGYARTSGNAESVHRRAYRLVHGDIPEGRQLHHICGVRHCVNPEHLEAVTPQEHRDRHPEKRGTGGSRPLDRCRKRGHPLTPDNTYTSSGRRWCKACVVIAREARAARPGPKTRRVDRKEKASSPASS